MNHNIEQQWQKRSWKKLRAFLWFEHLRTELGWSAGQIDAYGVEQGDRRSGNCYRWSQRSQAPSLDSVSRFAGIAPRSTSLFSDAPWHLLDIRALPSGKVSSLLNKFGRSQFFHPDKPTMVDVNGSVLADRYDFLSASWSSRTQRLAIFVFFRELGRLRELERHCGRAPFAISDQQGQPVFDIDAGAYLHLLFSSHLFRALPLLGQIPWLHKDFVYLCDLFSLSRYSCDLTHRSLFVDWEALGQQFYDPKLRSLVVRAHARRASHSEFDIEDPVRVHCELPMELRWPWPRDSTNVSLQ